MFTLRRTLIVVVILLLTSGGALAGWVFILPVTPEFEGTRGVKLPPGTTFESTLDSLTAAGVVSGTLRLQLVAQGARLKDRMRPGYYTWESGATAVDILRKIVRRDETLVRVLIPPGVTLERIATVGGRHLAAGPEGFREALQDEALLRELGLRPETVLGYLLPDTYLFRWLTPPADVLRHIKGHVDRLAEREGPLPEGYSLTDVLSMAAIVEWETSKEAEKARVAGVYYNRLRIGMPLQADPTVQFGLIEIEGQKRRLFVRDYQLDHPYNTYRFRGLPPGPITNPSASSIRAALKPESHPYLFFVAGAGLDGTHQFSATYAEHLRARDAYLAALNARTRR